MSCHWFGETYHSEAHLESAGARKAEANGTDHTAMAGQGDIEDMVDAVKEGKENGWE